MAHNTLALDLFLIGSSAILLGIYILFSSLKKKFSRETNKSFGILFLLAGFLALILTFEMFLFEPIPHQYIEIYGTMLAIFSLISLSGGLAIYLNSDLRPVSYLGGLGAILSFKSANSVLAFNLSKSPVSTAAIFILAGLSGLFTIVFSHLSNQKSKFWFSLVFSIVLFALGVLCMYTSASALFGHVASAIAPK